MKNRSKHTANQFKIAIQRLIRKSIIVFVFLIISLIYIQGANISSNGTGGGLWNVGATWAGGIPPGLGDNVTILSSDEVTLTDIEVCNNIIVQGTLLIQGFNFAVYGSTTITGILRDNNNDGITNFYGLVRLNILGTFNTESVTTAGNLIFQDGIWNDYDNINVTNFYAGSASFSSKDQILKGSGNTSFLMNVDIQDGITITNQTHVRILGDITQIGVDECTWTNISYLEIGGNINVTLNANTSHNIVNYIGSGRFQVIKKPLNTYYFLNVSNSNGCKLESDITVTTVLTMTSGNIMTGPYVLYLKSTSVDSLSHGDGTMIIGKFRRGVKSGGDYLFPVGASVGTSVYYRPATFNFSILGSAIDITAEFNGLSPGLITTPYSDAGVLLDNVFMEGFWSFSSSPAPSVNTYKLTLKYDGFTSINVNSRITGRNTDYPNWRDFGTHGNVNTSTSTITRNDIINQNLTSFDYALASSSCTLPVPGITGPEAVCVTSTGNVYSTETGLTNYIWTVSAGGAITGGQGTSNATITWNTAGPQSVSVMYTNANGCSASIPTVYPVTVNLLPVPVITGPGAACITSSGNVYSTETGMINYIWTVSAGGSITGGQGTSSTTITWNTVGPQSVSVIYDSGCGTSTPTVYPVTVNSLPVPVISGPGAACATSTGNVYSTETGMTNYIWTVSAGGAITGGQGTSSATIAWNTAGPQSVSVMYTNANGCSASTPTVYPVTVNLLPVPVITGPGAACITSTVNVYSTETGMINYIWTVSAGGTITGGQGTSSASITWNTAGSQSMSVIYTNGNGCSASTPTIFPVTVNTLPLGVATPTTQTICSHAAIIPILLTASNFPAGTTYAWTRDNTTNVTGLTNTGTGNISGTPINTTGANQVVRYTITPTSSDGCVGNTFTATVNVVPEAQVNQPLSEVVCNGANTTSVIFSSVNTVGTTTYTWTNSNTTIGLPAGGSGPIPSFIALNPGNAPAVAIISVTPHYTVGGNTCDGLSKTFTFTVNPTAQVSQPLNKLVCNGANNTAVTFSTVNTGGITTYSWTNSDISIGLAVNGTGDIPTFIATNTVTAPVVATIIVTPHFTNGGSTCNGPTKTFTITVYPAAQVNQPASEVLCNGASSTAVTFGTVNTGGTTTYTWTNNNTSIGLPAGGSGDISSFHATNTGSVPVVATINVTPHFTFAENTCDDPPISFTITVNPTAQVNQVPGEVVVNGDNTTAITFTTVNTGGVTTYSWINDNTSIGLAAGGTGNIASFVAINSGTSPVIATIVVTPHFRNGLSTCDGPTMTFTITVNPTGQVDQQTDQVVCNSGSTATVTFTTENTGGITTFSWTNNNSSIGLASSGTGNIASFSAINLSTSPVIATIFVTPHFSNEGETSDGLTESFTITVNPTAQVIQPLNKAFCNGANTTAINFTTINTGGITSYIWTNDNTLIGLAASGTGNISSFAAINSGTSPVTATIVVSPRFNFGGAICIGPSKTFIITVNPTAQVNQPSGILACNGADITATFATINTGGTATYSWTNDNTSIGLAASGTGIITPFAAINSGNSPVTASIIVTPHFTNEGNSCEGPSRTFTIVVEPTPQATIVSTIPTICNGSNINVAINSPTVTTIPANLSYVITVTSDNPGSLGGTASITPLTRRKLELPFSITGTLTNSSDAPIVVIYTVTPKLNSCSDGPLQSVTVTVNPTPRVIPVNSNLNPDSSICFGGTTQIVLTSPTVMTSGEIRFDYTVTAPGTISGDMTSETNRQPGYSIIRSYQNNSNAVQSLFYHITPYNNAICVPGIIVDSEIKVHPKTIQYNYSGTDGTGILITKPLTCETSLDRAAMKVLITNGADPYQISWTGPNSYSNNSAEITNLDFGKYTVTVTDKLGCNNESSKTIVNYTARPQIVANIKFPNIHVSCHGGSDGSLRVSVLSGITQPYNFWVIFNDADTLDNGVFSNSIDIDPNAYKDYTGLKAGIYKIVIRDVNGCEVARSTELKEPAPITVGFQKSNYNGFNVSCPGYSNGSVLAQPAGGNSSFSYLWYPAIGSLSVSTTTNLLDSVPAGKYYLITSDQLNCSQTDSVIIIEPDGMQLTNSVVSLSTDGNTNVSCKGGNDGFIKITITGGSGTYFYNWTGPDGFTANSKDISGLRAGIYACTVKDNNECLLISALSFTLTEPTAIAITGIISTSNDGSYNINCYGGAGSINITVSGGGVGTYLFNWSTTNGSGIVTGQEDQNSLTAGTYHLSVTDSNGCIALKDFTLTQPAVLVTVLVPTNITCESPGFNNGSINLTVTGGIAPYTFAWSNGASTEDIAGLTQGLYIITVTDANGCTRTDSIRVNLPPPLSYTKKISDYNGYGISCNGLANGFIQINLTNGSAPFVYTWTGPNGFTATTNDISGLKAGQYNLIITDKNFCTAAETISITEPGKFGMTISLSKSIAGEFNINCAGESTGSISIEPLNPVSTVSFLWADGIFGKTRNNLPAGIYSVIVIDGNNCHSDSVITLTEPNPIKLVLDNTKPFCPDKPDGEIKSKVTGGVMGADYSYKWSDNSTGPNLLNITAGFYTVTVNDLNGCSAKDSAKIVSLNETCLIIPNAISPNGDLINDIWNIGLIDLYPEVEIKIFNRWGELVWKSEKGYPRQWGGTSNGSPLPMDSYHYVINLHNGSKPIIGNVTIMK